MKNKLQDELFHHPCGSDPVHWSRNQGLLSHIAYHQSPVLSWLNTGRSSLSLTLNTEGLVSNKIRQRIDTHTPTVLQNGMGLTWCHSNILE